MNDSIFEHYRKAGNAPSASTGGGGFFKTLGRYTLPILKNIGERVLRVAAQTACDVVGQRRNLGDALLQHTSRELEDASRRGSEINKVGGIRKRKRALDIFTALKHRRLQ